MAHSGTCRVRCAVTAAHGTACVRVSQGSGALSRIGLLQLSGDTCLVSRVLLVRWRHGSGQLPGLEAAAVAAAPRSCAPEVSELVRWKADVRLMEGRSSCCGAGGVGARPAVAVCIQVTSEKFCRVVACACVFLYASCLCACKRPLVQFAASFLTRIGKDSGRMSVSRDCICGKRYDIHHVTGYVSQAQQCDACGVLGSPRIAPISSATHGRDCKLGKPGRNDSSVPPICCRQGQVQNPWLSPSAAMQWACK